MYSSLTLLKKYLQYLIKSKNGKGHGVHSPFVFTFIKEVLNKIKSQNAPIKVQFAKNDYHLVYYGDSPILNKLKYYPIALLLVAFLFGGVVYNFYRATKMATQNKLWAGMAKETAHQIGTPLSSLIGWTEILKIGRFFTMGYIYHVSHFHMR